MVHYIAELITEAEKDADARPGVRAEAVQAILSFWDHRHSVDRIDPLRSLKPILNVLATLDPDENRWMRLGRGGALHDMYESFRDIVIFSTIAQAKPASAPVPENPAVSEEEATIMAGLNVWLADYQKRAISEVAEEPTRRRSKEAGPKEKPFDAAEHLISQIANAKRALDALEREVRGLPPLQPDMSRLERLLAREVPTIEIELVDAEPDDSEESL
ncbi:hypothetical protein [Rhizobium leguminosarum]|uniref:hypothetical protein n=1 Tax=Rhizobium leguminosarum TaxID=384 RepID=UPI001C95ACA3|nr:hypothetical protein [Rhizobium leguminosarum]MBY5826576.1 hypothetical protein [Rhizobium leguminosarum]